MELGYDPLWDEQGRLRQGCTVGEALAWMTKFGGRTPGESVCINGVGYEPWHYRYVGEEAAGEIMRQGLCLEEYLGEC